MAWANILKQKCSNFPRLIVPIKYLREIQLLPFPIHVTDRVAIKRIVLLAATGMIEADIFPPLTMSARFRPHEAAVVSSITPEGRAELARDRAEKL